MSKNFPLLPFQGRTLYEQIRIVARNRNWPDDAAHCAGNEAVKLVDSNEKINDFFDLKAVANEVLRVD